MAPRFRAAIGLSLAAMMVFLAPLVAAVDRAVPKPPPPPAAPPAAPPTPPVSATRPAPSAPAVRATPSVPPVAPVAPATPAADLAPTIAPEGIAYAPPAAGPAVLAGVPAPAPAMPPTPPPTPAVGAAPVIAPAPAISPAPDTAATPRPAIAPPPPPAVGYSTGADPYVSATSSSDGHFGEISFSQSDDDKSTKLEGRNVTIANRATDITFSDRRGYLRVTQQWKGGEKRYVEVMPDGRTNKYVYRVNGSAHPWSAAAERVILDAFGSAPKKPMTPKPAAAPQAPAKASVVPKDARIAVAQFGGCAAGISWDTTPGKSRTAGAPPHAAPEGVDAHSPTHSWNTYSTPRALTFGTVDDSTPGGLNNGSCAKASQSATEAYLRAFGERGITLKASGTLNSEQYRGSLIERAREAGTHYLLEGNVVSVNPVPGTRTGLVVVASVETRLIRVSDGVIVDTRRDEARGSVQAVYQILARRFAKTVKPANS
jgi:hypothetical protein